MNRLEFQSWSHLKVLSGSYLGFVWVSKENVRESRLHTRNFGNRNFDQLPFEA